MVVMSNYIYYCRNKINKKHINFTTVPSVNIELLRHRESHFSQIVIIRINIPYQQSFKWIFVDLSYLQLYMYIK